MRETERKWERRTKRVRRMERGNHKKKCKDEQSKFDSENERQRWFR